MRNAKLRREILAIRGLLSRTEKACGDDIEARAHWAKYLCVVCAGFLENAIEEVYTEFCRRVAPEPVANYAVAELQRIQNPKAQRFLEVATSFKPSWGEDLRAYLEADGRKEAIDSIMAQRHNIAHGRPSAVSVVQVSNYFSKLLEVIEFIEGQCVS